MPEKSIEQVMDEAWNQTMGEAADQLPDEMQHLDVNDKPADSNAPATPSLSPEDTGTPPAPAEPAPASTDAPEGSTPPVVTAEPAGPPQHWSEADRTMFGTLPQEGQAFLLRRHREMEADYTRKTQEHATQVRVGTAALTSMDPGIRQQLSAAGVNDEQFVKNLVDYHKLSMTHPVDFVKQVVANLGLDPAKIWSASPEGGAPATPSDPVTTRLEAIESQIARDQQARNNQIITEAKTQLELFASEKGLNGEVLRPHYEKVKMYMGKLMAADPDLDLQGAYDVAVFRDPTLRGTGPAPAAASGVPAPVAIDQDKIRRGQEAAAAAKANRKGSGNGAAAPAAVPVKMSLQDAMKAAADEIGLE